MFASLPNKDTLLQLWPADTILPAGNQAVRPQASSLFFFVRSFSIGGQIFASTM